MNGNSEFHVSDDAAGFSLRPLTAGEVFDRTFVVYRHHFWLFTSIALVPALASLLSSVFRMTLMHFLHLSMMTSALAFLHPGLAIFTIVSAILTMAIYGSSQAASTIAVSSVYLGRPATARSSYEESLQHWIRYPLLILVQFLSASWITIAGYALTIVFIVGAPKLGMASAGFVALLSIFILFSFPYTVYRYIRVSLAVPASVVEHLPIRASLKRSKALLADRKGRIFLVILLLGVLYLVLGSAIAVVMAFAAAGKLSLIVASIFTFLTTFVASAVLQPIGAISLCLFYFDERVRREGFDIEFMLQSQPADSLPLDPLTPLDGTIEA